MAILTDDEKRKLRNHLEKEANATGLPIDYIKSEVHDALQAIENWFELITTKTAVSNAIDAGTTFSFSNPQKKKLVKFWLLHKYGKE